MNENEKINEKIFPYALLLCSIQVSSHCMGLTATDEHESLLLNSLM